MSMNQRNKMTDLNYHIASLSCSPWFEAFLSKIEKNSIKEDSGRGYDSQAQSPTYPLAET